MTRELIDKLGVIKALDEAKIRTTSEEYDRILDVIGSMPTIEERKAGKWVKHDTGHSVYYDCSLCSGLAKCTETDDAFVWKFSKYCSECGAKMEGVGE